MYIVKVSDLNIYRLTYIEKDKILQFPFKYYSV